MAVYPAVFRAAGAPDTWRQRLMAACLWGTVALPDRWPKGAGAVVSHQAAAALHALDGFPEGPAVITSARQPRFAGSSLTVHRASPDGRFTVMKDGLPVTNVARTLVDLAVILPRDRFERAMDDALRRHLATERQLRWTAAEVLKAGAAGRRGAKALLKVLDGRGPLDGPSASAYQKELRALLMGGGLTIVEEKVILSEDGSFIARCDIEVDEGVLVEGESRKFHSHWADQVHDYRRRNRLTAEGRLVVHVTPADLKERPREVLAEVWAAVRKAGALRAGSSA